MVEARIHKVLADAGVASRRGAEALVAAGRVRVNGAPAVTGQRVDPARDEISVDGRPLVTGDRQAARVYLALNKPAGVTSTVRDPHAERTVLDLIPDAERNEGARLYPVGRLDRDSEGLLLLTNDGAWAERVLHPRFGVEREYAIGLRMPLSPTQMRVLREGVELEEGRATVQELRQATSVEVRRLGLVLEQHSPALHWYRATLRQGWRRQLRRMFAVVGQPVARLVRVRVGTLWLAEMRPGDVRRLRTRDAELLAGGGGTEPSRGGRGRSSTGTVPNASQSASAAADDPRSGPDRRRAGLVVTLDGAASSGKSSVGAAAAKRLGYRFCDTGLLYRALTWVALERGVPLDDEDALVELVPQIALRPDEDGRLIRVEVGGVDVSRAVREPRVDRRVSEVARQPRVREAFLPRQRQLAEGGRIIVAGRDIGTVVLPDADLKLFLDVSLPERARRRAEERGISPGDPRGAGIEEQLRQRDAIDSTRDAAPLRVPEDAVVIKADANTLDQTVGAVVDAVEARAAAVAR